MSHIGLVTPAYTGHLNPMINLGRELQRRGHRVSVIATPDAQEATVRNGLEFLAVGAAEFPVGTLERFTDRQGRLTGIPAIRLIIKDLLAVTRVHRRELLDLVNRHGIDALVADQLLPGVSIVCRKSGRPFVNLCSLLPLNADVSVPPFLMPWPYAETTQARVQNSIAYRVQALVERPIVKEANRWERSWGLPTTDVDGSLSTLAQIAQIPEVLDYPRKNAPDCFHHTGPMHDFEASDPVPFPWERLDGRPLIYGTMGTLQNRLTGVFRIMAEACADLDAQLVISLGRRDAPIPTDLPGDPIVVGYAPQLDLLRRAALFVGHGGQNTVLQALAYGVPMVLMPAATDQPGVSARAKHIGVAEFVPVRRASARKLRALIDTVTSTPSYRQNAEKLQHTIRGLDGVHRAADIVEEAFRTGRPVLRPVARV